MVRVTTVIVTYERPAFLARVLESLGEQTEPSEQIIVVDSSLEPTDLKDVKLPVMKLHTPELAGWMTRARNAALLYVSGDVVAFLDDDVVVHPEWAQKLRRTYSETHADAVVGRTRNLIEGEEVYEGPVGRLLPDGHLTDGFASDTFHRIAVHHGIGANMSFTTKMIAHLGGFRDDYPGTAMREDTDIFLRVGRVGGSIVFDPEVVVDHLPAPHVKGARFDRRYELYARRNHVVLLARQAGINSTLLRKWIAGQYRDAFSRSNARARMRGLALVALGTTWGIAVVPRYAGLRPTPPVLYNRQAVDIREALQAAVEGSHEE